MKKMMFLYVLLMIFLFTSCEPEATGLPEIDSETDLKILAEIKNTAEPLSTQKPASDNSGETEKRTLRITYADTYGSTMFTIASSFQMRNPDIEVIYTDFDGKTADELEKYKAQLPVKIMSGMTEDLFTMSGLSIPNLADKGIIADIYELMNADDKFIQDDYFSEAWKAFEYKNALYGMPLDIYCQFMVINKKAPEEIIQKYNKLVTVSYYDIIQLYNESGMKDSLFMENMYNVRQGIRDEAVNYMDYENKTCNFNDPSFIEKLQYYKDALEPGMESTYSYIYSDGWVDNASRDSEKYMFRFLEFKYELQYAVEYEENYFVYPKPIADGTGKIKIGITVDPFLLSQASKSKDLAWEFLKFALSYDMQNKYIYYWPINKKAFFDRTGQDQIKAEIDAIFMKGKLRRYDESSSQSAKRVADFYAKVFELPFTTVNMEERVQNVINSEVLSFVNDIITAEQAASNIQNRVSLMLKE